MKKILLGIFILIFIAVACSTTAGNFSNKPFREATNSPENFLPGSGKNFEDSACISPLIDPRDGTEIYMRLSFDGLGDYEVPAGKYGVKPNEYLRVICQTGEVIGIVKR